MTRSGFFILWFLCQGVLGPLVGHSFAEEIRTPWKKAEEIARSSPTVLKHLEELRRGARLIHDPVLRKATLEMLGRPTFLLASRRSEEAAIRGKLIQMKLLDPAHEPVPLIPKGTPMPFIAAPGSFWIQHHTYPGGLVFHTLTNFRNAASLAQNWEHVNGITLNSDWLRAAPIWHDSAKSWILEWNQDGSATPSEGEIAGTGAHHVLGVAEALMRGFPPDLILVQASAHAPPNPSAGLADLTGYLRAACVLAGVPFSRAGLTEDGSKLLRPAPLEAFIHHLSDHDWVASEVSMAEAEGALKLLFQKPGAPSDYWVEDGAFAQWGDLRITATFRRSGLEGLKKLLGSKSTGD